MPLTERLTPENILQDHGHRGAPFCGGDQGAREGPLLYVRNQSSYLLTRTKLIHKNLLLQKIIKVLFFLQKIKVWFFLQQILRYGFSYAIFVALVLFLFLLRVAPSFR